MREMIDDYSRQLDLRDGTIRRLESQEMAQQNELSMLIYKENETLKQENTMLKDKVAILDQELMNFEATRPTEHQIRGLHDELARLNSILREKDMQLETQNTQKNEWADIYGQQKQK